MIESENDILKTLKDTPKYKQLKKAKRIFIINKIKRISKYIIISGLMICIIFFPTQTGSLIGNWINDFFGTIINSIK